MGIIKIGVAALAVIGLAAGCSSSNVTATPSQSSEAAIPTATSPDPSLVVQVDCGDEGVANVTIKYGTGTDEKILVGKRPLTLAAGGVKSISNKYGTAPGFGDATLTVTTAPTTGTCSTSITDYASGEVVGKRETAGMATLTAVVPGDTP